MFDRNGPLRITATVAIATSMVAGCSSMSGDSEDEKLRQMVTGTTSAPSTLDPAAAWDGSWELYKNVYQTLLSFPSSSSSPEPDAAKRCGFTDSASRVYRCTLRDGLKFSNGNALDSRAVKHSIDRVMTIKAKSGPLGLMGSLDRVEAPDKRTVVFHLKKSDATFPFILATPATAIVDPESYPAKKLRKGNKIVGSGPYTLKSYSKGKKAELSRYEGYHGPAKPKNDVVTIEYFQDSAKMVKALKEKKIDVAYRGLTPGQVSGFQKAQANGNQEIELTELLGSEISYLVFNPKDRMAGNPAVRKAIAELIDRKALVRNVYNRTTDPLYSMVPGGITGHTSAFYDRYGEPSKDQARKTLSEAGIDKKVPLTLWYTTDRYGDTTGETFAELKRQLNKSGLFDVTVKGRPWSQFVEGYSKGKYPVFGRGWFPDFPDADNYVAPFVGKNNALATPYDNAQITDELLPQSRKESNRATASKKFTTAQKIIAKDARLLPLWQGRVYVASLKDVAGVEWVMDPSTLPRLWELHMKSSW
ncbi:peptide/nickel transport system substrate-binding protein [Streptomyces sp. Amel2xB2]|uniref:ABC transporter substrate-binding protein n=1 Tax=Streptomyces sp. Amel2xB2 TaxID=1305829 RepID=UPI000DC0262A|nr:ABC transporter substrate-binding protein [Streptomyces sp. Amel2xB2]RAJ57499.1 peptide/nickel transport system substrate-binding protein [Streptomyces sp. Amel2xB2]